MVCIVLVSDPVQLVEFPKHHTHYSYECGHTGHNTNHTTNHTYGATTTTAICPVT